MFGCTDKSQNQPLLLGQYDSSYNLFVTSKTLLYHKLILPNRLSDWTEMRSWAQSSILHEPGTSVHGKYFQIFVVLHLSIQFSVPQQIFHVTTFAASPSDWLYKSLVTAPSMICIRLQKARQTICLGLTH